jgi:hypothetical protein
LQQPGEATNQFNEELMSRYLNKTNLWPVLGVIVIIAIGVFMRLTVYGDLRLSVANADTASYVESSKVNLLSWDAFTSYRPFTTNLVYKIFTPQDGYRYRAVSNGATGTIKRKIDRGFKDIAVLHSVVSTLAWASLAWTFSTQLKNTMLKMVAAGLILVFGFTPQIADWDSVMSPESLSISLFVLAFSLLIWLVFAFYKQPAVNSTKIVGAIALCITLFFWIFTRDVNVYSLIFLALLIPGFYIIPWFRNTKFFLIAGAVVLLLFMVGAVSARQRPLWQLALGHVWVSDILRFPANIEYFRAQGMPEQNTPAYADWFNKHARTSYIKFLMAHPAYTAGKFFRDMNLAIAENMQPYFTYNESFYRSLLIMAGNYIHAKSAAIFIIVLLLLILLWTQAIFQNRTEAYPWACVLTWAFLTASATMFFSIFGDSWGLVRHALSSTATYRLLMWMLLLIIFDFSLVRAEQNPPSLIPSEGNAV